MSSAEKKSVHIIGAGLAGSEAAFFLAENGIQVHLYEMRPQKTTPAHHTGNCAELVCSNSFKSKSPVSASGILKTEMAEMNSLTLRAAAETEVPGGEALTVDRDLFSEFVTGTLRNHPLIQIHSEEVCEPFSDAPTLIATGPLTTEGLSQWIARATGEDKLYFYDAIAPIVDATTIDMSQAFLANRNDKGGEAAYINCPLNEEEYQKFIDALESAEKVPSKNFEKEKFFQGCQPIEAIAAGGRESLRFGPMKPVGLHDPRTGKKPYAVVQLRPENQSRTAYNLVGFQTKLKYGEQKRVFQLIPALAQAEFFRLGSIHRNTYVCSPEVLRPDLSLKGHPQVYFAGQITGVEGYLESAACGMIVACFMLQRLRGLAHQAPPANTGFGTLLRHLLASSPKNFQPANMQFGLFEPHLYQDVIGLKRTPLREAISKQSKTNFSSWYARLQNDIKYS